MLTMYSEYVQTWAAYDSPDAMYCALFSAMRCSSTSLPSYGKGT